MKNKINQSIKYCSKKLQLKLLTKTRRYKDLENIQQIILQQQKHRRRKI